MYVIASIDIARKQPCEKVQGLHNTYFQLL